MCLSMRIFLGLLVLLACVGSGYVAAQNRLIPPPPVDGIGSDSSFTAEDRRKLSTIYWNTKALRGKMFPKLEDGTSIREYEVINPSGGGEDSPQPPTHK